MPQFWFLCVELFWIHQILTAYQMCVCVRVCMHVYVSFVVEINLYVEVDWILSNCLRSAKTLQSAKNGRSQMNKFQTSSFYFLPIWCQREKEFDYVSSWSLFSRFLWSTLKQTTNEPVCI